MGSARPYANLHRAPAPHYSVFYWPDALPAAQPTASKHWRHRHIHRTHRRHSSYITGLRNTLILQSGIWKIHNTHLMTGNYWITKTATASTRTQSCLFQSPPQNSQKTQQLNGMSPLLSEHTTHVKGNKKTWEPGTWLSKMAPISIYVFNDNLSNTTLE